MKDKRACLIHIMNPYIISMCSLLTVLYYFSLTIIYNIFKSFKIYLFTFWRQNEREVERGREKSIDLTSAASFPKFPQ